jgi:hypothetical protein
VIPTISQRAVRRPTIRYRPLWVVSGHASIVPPDASDASPFMPLNSGLPCRGCGYFISRAPDTNH